MPSPLAHLSYRQTIALCVIILLALFFALYGQGHMGSVVAQANSYFSVTPASWIRISELEQSDTENIDHEQFIENVKPKFRNENFPSKLDFGRKSEGVSKNAETSSNDYHSQYSETEIYNQDKLMNRLFHSKDTNPEEDLNTDKRDKIHLAVSEYSSPSHNNPRFPTQENVSSSSQNQNTITSSESINSKETEAEVTLEDVTPMPEMTLHYVWCGQRFFDFRNYVAVKSVIDALMPNKVGLSLLQSSLSHLIFW